MPGGGHGSRGPLMMNLTLILLHVAMSVESKSAHRFPKGRAAMTKAWKVVRVLVPGDASCISDGVLHPFRTR